MFEKPLSLKRSNTVNDSVWTEARIDNISKTVERSKREVNRPTPTIRELLASTLLLSRTAHAHHLAAFAPDRKYSSPLHTSSFPNPPQNPLQNNHPILLVP
jgi:hypothetical protein